MKSVETIKIKNTNLKDWDIILQLFDDVMNQQSQNGYRVWESIDKAKLREEIKGNLHYKILQGDDFLCIFSIQLNDPFIWRDRDKNDAIYLHRIVANPKFKGQKIFQMVLDWAINFAKTNNLKFIRMDTWADNTKIIDYYKSFGFNFIQNYQTANLSELPVQHRNLNVALLEYILSEED